MANKPNNPALWSKAKSMAKQKFDVYPSAYSNGWAAKWYKSKGGTWRKAAFGMEVPYANGGEPDNAGFQALPEYVQQKIMNNMSSGGFIPKMQQGGEPDGAMALGQINAAMDKLSKLRQFIQPDTDLEPWVSSKLTLLDHYTDAVSDYMMYNPEAQGEEEVEEMPMTEEEMEQMSYGGSIPDRYRNMGFTKVGVKKKSNRPGKKWMVLAKKGDQYKVVHGGYKGMEDFTQHHNNQRRENFWNRMGGKDSAKARDPFSPLYWHKRFGTWAEGGEIPDFQNGGLLDQVKNVFNKGYDYVKQGYDYVLGNDIQQKAAAAKPISVPVTPQKTTPYDSFNDYYWTRQSNAEDSLVNNNAIRYPSGKTVNLSSGRFRGAKVPQEILTNAIEAAKKQNIDPYKLISLIGRESTFGVGDFMNTTRANDKRQLVSGWSLPDDYFPYRPERFLADKKVPGIAVSKNSSGWYYYLNEPEKMNKYLAEHPELLEQYKSKVAKRKPIRDTDAFDMAAEFIKNKPIGKYNPGDPNYTKQYLQDLELLRSDPALSAFMRSAGYKLGGQHFTNSITLFPNYTVPSFQNGGEKCGITTYYEGLDRQASKENRKLDRESNKIIRYENRDLRRFNEDKYRDYIDERKDLWGDKVKQRDFDKTYEEFLAANPNYNDRLLYTLANKELPALRGNSVYYMRDIFKRINPNIDYSKLTVPQLMDYIKQGYGNAENYLEQWGQAFPKRKSGGQIYLPLAQVGVNVMLAPSSNPNIAKRSARMTSLQNEMQLLKDAQTLSRADWKSKYGDNTLGWDYKDAANQDNYNYKEKEYNKLLAFNKKDEESYKASLAGAQNVSSYLKQFNTYRNNILDQRNKYKEEFGIYPEEEVDPVKIFGERVANRARTVIKDGKGYPIYVNPKETKTCINGVCSVYADEGVRFDPLKGMLGVNQRKDGKYIPAFNPTWVGMKQVPGTEDDWVPTGENNYEKIGFRRLNPGEKPMPGDFAQYANSQRPRHAEIVLSNVNGGVETFNNYDLTNQIPDENTGLIGISKRLFTNAERTDPFDTDVYDDTEYYRPTTELAESILSQDEKYRNMQARRKAYLSSPEYTNTRTPNTELLGPDAALFNDILEGYSGKYANDKKGLYESLAPRSKNPLYLQMILDQVYQKKYGGSNRSGNAFYKNGGMPCLECGGMFAYGGYPIHNYAEGGEPKLDNYRDFDSWKMANEYYQLTNNTPESINQSDYNPVSADLSIVKNLMMPNEKDYLDYETYASAVDNWMTNSANNAQVPVLDQNNKKVNETPKINYKGVSIVDLLNSVGKPSDYNSRKQLAAQLGINDYYGSSKQNMELVKKITNNPSVLDDYKSISGPKSKSLSNTTTVSKLQDGKIRTTVTKKYNDGSSSAKVTEDVDPFAQYQVVNVSNPVYSNQAKRTYLAAHPDMTEAEYDLMMAPRQSQDTIRSSSKPMAQRTKEQEKADQDSFNKFWTDYDKRKIDADMRLNGPLVDRTNQQQFNNFMLDFFTKEVPLTVATAGLPFIRWGTKIYPYGQRLIPEVVNTARKADRALPYATRALPFIKEMGGEYGIEQYNNGGISIDPKKKGTFKAQATRMGMSTQEAAAHILANKEDYSPAMVKKANFARNFAKQMGGLVEGAEIDVTPEEAEMLRQQGYTFEIL